MDIKLKNISFSEALSQETNAYTCDVYVDGVKCAYAHNSGHGGCTDYHSYENKKDLLREAENHCLALPAYTWEYGGTTHSLPMNLEMVIDNLLEEWLKAKDKIKMQKKLAKDCLKGICYGTETSYGCLFWKNRPLAIMLSNPNGKLAVQKELIKLKEKGENILNINIPKELL